MEALFTYLFQASLVLTLLYGVYWALLAKLTFFQLNRVVLLSIVCGSLLLPVLRPSILRLPFAEVGIPRWNRVADWPASSLSQNQVAPLKGISTTASPSLPTTKPAEGTYAATPQRILGGGTESVALSLASGLVRVYWLVTAFFLGKILFEVLALLQLTRSGRRQQLHSCLLVETKERVGPLSFFKLIILNPAQFAPARLGQIIQHEQVHAGQWHSLDVLLVECFGAFFWFDPLAWLLKREIKLNLEYIADEQVLRLGTDRKEYQYHLLQMTVPTASISAVSYFNFSHLKSRIARMNENPSTRRALWRYGLLLPASTLLLLVIQPMDAARRAPARLPASITRGITTNPQAIGAAPGKAIAGKDTNGKDVNDKDGASNEPLEDQPLPKQQGTQVLGRTQTSTTSQSNVQDAGLAKPLEPVKPSNTQLVGSPEGRTMLAVGALASRPFGTNQEHTAGELGETDPSSLARDTSQTTTASDLAPYLKLESSQNIYLAIRASLSEHDLESVANHLREIGLQVQFTNLHYNLQHQLTRIQLRVSIGNCAGGKACFDQTLEAYNQGAPLEDDKPLVFYLSRRINKAGVSFGYPKELSGNDLSALQHITGSMIGNYGGG